MIGVGSPQWLYMAESEGILNTRQGNINKAIKDFQSYYDLGFNIDSPALQEKVLSRYGLNHNLTPKESRQIISSLKR